MAWWKVLNAVRHILGYVIIPANSSYLDAQVLSPFTPVSLQPAFQGKCLAIHLFSVALHLSQTWNGSDLNMILKGGQDGTGHNNPNSSNNKKSKKKKNQQP